LPCDPLAFVISKNLKRRHLNESQRAMVAARLATLEWGQRKTESPIGDSVTQKEASDLLNVGKRSVERARKVLEHGQPELIAAVERGEIAVSAAAEQALGFKRSKEIQGGPPVFLPADQFEQLFRGGAVAAVDGGFYSR
jgi:hypothetical protein